MVKVVQGVMISNDKSMYQAKNDINTTVQSSNLNEELGQVEYIFSDKTGTLTCNEMEFKKICVNGKVYGENRDLDIKRFRHVTNVDFKDKVFYDSLKNENDAQHVANKYFKLKLYIVLTI